MQTVLDALVLESILIALLNQFIWVMMIRMGRGRYISDITHFRPPKSSLSRYYGWRVASVTNVVSEGIAFHIILLSTILGISFTSGVILNLLDILPILLFIFGLSILSAVQMIWRVKKLKKREYEIMLSMSASEFKIDAAQTIIENLYTLGQGSDGQMWFALFQIAQRRDPIGYSIRDVLIEKGKEVLRESAYSPLDTSNQDSSSEPGPGLV